MDVKSYRAETLQAALKQVREELGPDASVLETRKVTKPWWRCFAKEQPSIEVKASADANVPSRLPSNIPTSHNPQSNATRPTAVESPNISPGSDFRHRIQAGLRDQILAGHLLEPADRGLGVGEKTNLPESVFQLFTELVDAEVPEAIARELIFQLQETATNSLGDIVLLRQRAQRIIEDQLNICGPIRITPGQCRTVALVGPTGVGKTTTIAKLAANFRLRDKLRVGFITVDTYRIAAVEQLRTYAEIIDLPMEVVSTPREMRDAVCRLADLDLILIDTAGRNPGDEVRIQELKSLLAEAAADEVHLVLSSVGSPKSLVKTARLFAPVGTNALLLTKTDEAMSLGNVLPVARECDLPMSYLTNGQNVPDDIRPVKRDWLAKAILGQKINS